jgi:hypothetical protein
MSSANQLVILLKLRNPYPPDIFTPLTDAEHKKFIGVLKRAGFSPDKIHAQWGRYVWGLAADELAQILDEGNFAVVKRE